MNPEVKLRKEFDDIVKCPYQTADLIEPGLRINNFFAFKQKNKSMKKVVAVRQKVHLNQVVVESSTKPFND